MAGEVARLWASEATMADKRAAVLELWSGLDATPPPDRDRVLAEAVADSLDEARVEAAADARAVISRSIALHAPAGSPDAFTDAELRAFNEATDGTPLCPYDSECPGAAPSSTRRVGRAGPSPTAPAG